MAGRIAGKRTAAGVHFSSRRHSCLRRSGPARRKATAQKVIADLRTP